MSPSIRAVFLPFLLSLIPRSIANEKCYYPDGSVITDPIYPCNPSAEGGSACCGEYVKGLPAVCTDTGLCVGHSGLFYRGGCTVSDFNSVACSIWCLSVQTDQLSNIYPCDNGQWCCAGSDIENCCDNTELVMNNTIDWGSYFLPKRATGSGSSSSSPASSSPTTGGGGSRSGSGGSASGKSNDKQSSGSDSDLGTIIGAAVGAPLGILAVGILFWLFWKEKRKEKNLEKDNGQSMYPLVGAQNRQSGGYGDRGSPPKGAGAYYTDQEGDYRSPERVSDRHELSHRPSQRRELE